MAVEVTVLGSGTFIPSGSRRSAGHFVSFGSTHILMDCGSGTMHGMARWGAPWEEISHILLTHFHTDHISDLAPVLAALSHGLSPRRVAPLIIIGPPGIRDLMCRLAEAFGGYVLDPGFQLEILELEHNSVWSDEARGFSVSTHPTQHTDSSVAYRVAADTSVVVYTGDTGPQVELGKFAAGASLIISECAYPDPPRVETHLTPSGLAELAREASPHLLVVTHVYRDLDIEDVSGLIAGSGYTGRVLLAEDGMKISLVGGEAHLL